ncbi:hypothetical protein [Leucobacter sp. OH1287]|uniref:hypothetical protein n=1 Tax=Leucobacter sp. OH1287 TaxID=2491049 RepID=UPI000F5D5B68|nr:hypothetical protein [Leucobacter sp. OH1287]RRD59533.1 hypothetical protein EII30_08595 [Leucobacter sp. OH1287]
MTPADYARILKLASAYDNRQVTTEAAIAWHAAVEPELSGAVDVDEALAATTRYFASQPRGEYFTPARLLEQVRADFRLGREQIRADVSAAKAYGLVASDWGRCVPLPRGVREELAERRRVVQEEADRLALPAVSGVHATETNARPVLPDFKLRRV